MYHEGIAGDLELLHPDFLVIGAGVAGLRAAIELAPAGRVLVLSKDTLRESASEYAQGGIAAALSDDDEVDFHEQDTIKAGDGLCDRDAVRALVTEGPPAIEQLIEWGAQFDREEGELLFGREGAHSRRRVLHSHGDSTGREISRALYAKAASYPTVEFRNFAAITDLVLSDGQVQGALAWEAAAGRMVRILARSVLLATGGLGRLYRETTNPDVATGDGVAIAWRAGAAIGDIEFVQFHPTALHLEGAPRFLLSEALRGEGAYLRNGQGERFTGELAPRDIVSRAIAREMARTGLPHVFLDLTHLAPGFAARRFPRIYETCLRYGLDLERNPAPVTPAAHYAMGGVQTDLEGRTNIPMLSAAGEVACTGVHGANRLASNSLLEGVVFGARAGRAMRDAEARPGGGGAGVEEVRFPLIAEHDLRGLTWEACGIERHGDELRAACRRLENLSCAPRGVAGRADYELRNMAQAALLIARCALAREESRGGHHRRDFPEKRAEFQKHSLVIGSEPVRFLERGRALSSGRADRRWFA